MPDLTDSPVNSVLKPTVELISISLVGSPHDHDSITVRSKAEANSATSSRHTTPLRTGIVGGLVHTGSHVGSE